MHAPIYKIGKFTGIFIIQCKASIDIDCEVPAADTSCWTTSLTCVAMVALFQCAGIAHIFICFIELSRFYILHQGRYCKLEGRKAPRLFNFIGMPEFYFPLVVTAVEYQNSTSRFTNGVLNYIWDIFQRLEAKCILKLNGSPVEAGYIIVIESAIPSAVYDQKKVIAGL